MEGVVQVHVATRTEIEDLRGVVDRNLRDAAIAGLSEDNRLGLAYEAVLVSSKMVVHASGYRVRPTVAGAHARTLECAELALGAGVSGAIAYFNTVRRRRNTLSYDAAGTVSDVEARDALKQARAYKQMAEGWVAKNHPGLV